MNAVAFLDAVRARYLARLAADLRGTRMRGGELAARVAPLANAARVEVRLHPSEHTRQILFAGATTNVPLSESAAALMAWAICRLAGEQRAGLPEEARRTLPAVTRLIHAWPMPIAHRFEPRIDAL